jgi:hypothetical protein
LLRETIEAGSMNSACAGRERQRDAAGFQNKTNNKNKTNQNKGARGGMAATISMAAAGRRGTATQGTARSR